MKLTKLHRSAFVKGVMADVPMVDYEDMIRNQALKGVIQTMPEEVRVAYIKHPTWFRNQAFWIECMSIFIPTDSESTIPKSVLASLQPLLKQLEAQNNQRKVLCDKITSVAESCSTRKTLLAALPEFEKYLPVDMDNPANRMVPALANVVADFVQAGWPASKVAAS